MSTKLVIATVAAVAYFLWKLKSKTDEDDVAVKDSRSSLHSARSTALQLGHGDRRESQNVITTYTASDERESDEPTHLRSLHSNESRRYREEYPQLLQRSTRSSEQGGIVPEASFSSTAATRSDIPGFNPMPNRTTESRRYREEYPQLIQRSTRSSEQGGIVTEASFSSTAATRSDIPGLSAMPNRTTESRRYRDEFPPLIQTSTRSSEQGGIVTEASYSSTAATRSAIPGLSAMPNRITERRYFADDVNEPDLAQENENQHRNITGRQGGAVAVRSEQASHSAMINNTNSFREEAEDHLNKMIEYKRRAKTSEKKNKGEFTKLAKMERKLMEEADRKAVELILEKGSPGFPYCPTLDLHRLYIKEALPLVDRFLQTNMKLRKKVFIITGKGDHSKGPRSTLRDAIMEYLPEKGHRFREDAKKKGEFTVYFVERRR